MRRKFYSNTYPEGWTESEREAALAALSKEEKRSLAQCWETPPDFWSVLNNRFDFEIDLCASKHNKKCPRYISEAQNSLLAETYWLHGGVTRGFCNPGFAKVQPWHEKAEQTVDTMSEGACIVIVGIPGASQDWFSFAYRYADEIVHLADRVQYLAPWPLQQSDNTRESMLFVYRHKLVRDRPAKISWWDWRAELHEDYK